jgi:hypothetical protein
MTEAERERLSRNLAEVIDDLYRQHAPPRDHERLIQLVQVQIRHAMSSRDYRVTAPRRDPLTFRSELDDWDLFSKTASVVIKALRVEGRKNMATMSPATVAVLAGILRNLLAQWPDLPPETKRKLAAAKTSQAVSSLVPKRPQIETEFDD